MAAWEREILTPVMEDSFLAFGLYVMPNTEFAQSNLHIWRIDRSGEKPVVRMDLNGLKSTSALNDCGRGQKWNVNNVGVGVWSVRADQQDLPSEDQYQQVLPSQLKRLEALDPDDPSIPQRHADALRWLRGMQSVLATYQKAIGINQATIARLRMRQQALTAAAPPVIEQTKTRVVVERHIESDDR